MTTTLHYRGYAIEVIENGFRLKLFPTTHYTTFEAITQAIDTIINSIHEP